MFLSCVFINFIFVFSTSDQDCNFGMQKRTHFRTEMEHNICHVSLGYQFCKNITFILYIIMQGIIDQFTLFSINISALQFFFLKTFQAKQLASFILISVTGFSIRGSTRYFYLPKMGVGTS